MTQHLPKHLLDCTHAERVNMPEHIVAWREKLNAVPMPITDAGSLPAVLRMLVREEARQWGSLVAERCARTRQQFDARLVAFLGVASDRPAVATMWAYTVTRWQAANNETLTLDMFEALMGDTLPAERYAHSIWLSQKREFGGYTDNWLDTDEAWT